MTYFEKLKDPRWQRRRLEIMNRDNFSCGCCGSKTAQLHVHHRRYEQGKDPWDYPDSNFATLCDGCHLRVTELKKEIGACLDDRVVLEAYSHLSEMLNTEDQAQIAIIIILLRSNPHEIEGIYKSLYERYVTK